MSLDSSSRRQQLGKLGKYTHLYTAYLHLLQGVSTFILSARYIHIYIHNRTHEEAWDLPESSGSV